jgi:hypothetical protein
MHYEYKTPKAFGFLEDENGDGSQTLVYTPFNHLT